MDFADEDSPSCRIPQFAVEFPPTGDEVQANLEIIANLIGPKG
jgi:hypothetical protein